MLDSDNGVYIGELSTLQYEVSGMVYAVDEETIHIEDFHYNGKGPDAFFYIGRKSSSPDHTGEIIPYPQDVNTRSHYHIYMFFFVFFFSYLKIYNLENSKIPKGGDPIVGNNLGGPSILKYISLLFSNDLE